MEITLSKKNKTEGLLTIRMSRADYLPRFEEKLKEYARHAHIKGFRQGKVPTGLIKKMYGRSIFADEINHLLNQHISEYIKNQKLNVVGDLMPASPGPASWDADTTEEVEMQFHVGLADEFTCELSEKIKFNRYTIEVADQVVQDTVQDLRKRFSKSAYPECSEPGDDVYGTLQSDDGALQCSAYLRYEWLTPEGQQLITGRKKGDELELTLPDIISSPEYIGRMFSVKTEEEDKLKGKFRLKVMGITRMLPAEMNQEFFDRVFGKDVATTEEAFLNKVRETIAANYNRETEAFLHHEIEDHLIKNTKINLPEDFLRNWLKTVNPDKFTDEVLEKEFPAFLRTLKWNLIKKKIAEDHQINVTEEEVANRAANLLVQEFGASEALLSQLDKLVHNYLTHENGRNFNRLYDQLQLEKIMNAIKEKIKLNEKSITLEEFRKMVEKHNH
ncbi:MAG: trigger factor [Cyclobacteriaceae bacterium]|nr:MAG: trigger factor [Cyclobacteriaceae bacterium]